MSCQTLSSKALRRSQTVIPLAVDGTIEDANTDFLDLMGYRLTLQRPGEPLRTCEAVGRIGEAFGVRLV